MDLPFVHRFIDRDVVDSTSDLARTLVQSGEVDLPLVVRARRQTRGRGRGQNTWWSDAGSLTFTLALDPVVHGLEPQHEPRIALAVAVAIVDTMASVVPSSVSFGIRWPNDVEADGRKLAGILPERVETPFGARILIGVGMNLETRLDHAPAELRRMAVSVREITPISELPPNPEWFLHASLAKIWKNLDQLARGHSTLPTTWRMLDVLKGRPVRVDLGTEIVAGVGAGIDDEGALCVATERSLLRLFGGRVLRDV